ncbi:MAG: NADH-quinone oxidoreductase subunit C [Ignavibacteria bacterium]
MSEKLNSLKEKLVSIKEFSALKITEINNYPYLEVPVNKIIEISKILKYELGFDLLVDIVGVDRFTKKNRFELIYNLWSVEGNNRVFMRIILDSKKPEVESVSSIWETANWEEREAYDMFGIIFSNHPDFRRIYMMDEFEYFPLRKDFPLMGIPGSIQLPKK